MKSKLKTVVYFEVADQLLFLKANDMLRVSFARVTVSMEGLKKQTLTSTLHPVVTSSVHTLPYTVM